jgi:hypothetical protein
MLHHLVHGTDRRLVGVLDRAGQAEPLTDRPRRHVSKSRRAAAGLVHRTAVGPTVRAAVDRKEGDAVLAGRPVRAVTTSPRPVITNTFVAQGKGTPSSPIRFHWPHLLFGL